MSTKYLGLFAALAAPFEPGQVKQRSQAGRTFHYITARVAMNRLDEVVGPENWWDSYHPLENSVICKLTIRLPDGQELTKSDAGGYAGMADSGDDDKSGFSDAFKRAAAKFGVARYLYRDGVPDFGQQPEPAANGHAPARNLPRGNPQLPPAREPDSPNRDHDGPPRSGKALYAWAKEQEQRHEVGLIKHLNDWSKLREFPSRMIDWDAEQVALGHAEAVRKLGSISAAPEDAIDPGSPVGDSSAPADWASGEIRTWKDLYRWAKRQEEDTKLSILNGIKSWAESHGKPRDMEAWDDATIAAAHAYALGKINPSVPGVQQGLPDGPEPIESLKKRLKRSILDLASMTYRVDRPDKTQIDATMGVLRNLAGACSKPMLTAVDPLGEEHRELMLFYIDQATQEMEVIANGGISV